MPLLPPPERFARPPAPASAAPSRRASGASTTAVVGSRLPRAATLALAGILPALLFSSCAPVAVMGSGMSAIVHEMGHTVVSLFFGTFAVPAVVMTFTFEQSKLAAGAIWIGLCVLAWKFRREPVGLALFGTVAVLYPMFAFTRGHLTLFSLAGHGSEVVLGAVFLRRGIGGGLFSDWERPVWSFFGTSLVARNIAMDWNLITSAIYRETYDSVSFTGGDNDFTKVANTHGLTVEYVATAMLIATVILAVAGIALGIVAARRPRDESSWVGPQ